MTALQKLQGVVNSVPPESLDDPTSKHYLNPAARKWVSPKSDAKRQPFSKMSKSKFKSRTHAQAELEELEKAKGIEPGSTIKKMRKRTGKGLGIVKRTEILAALKELEGATASAVRNPSPAAFRRAENASRAVVKSLSQQRAEDRQAARNAKPSTPNLDKFNGLSGSAQSAFYKSNRSELRAEQNDLAAFESRQSK